MSGDELELRVAWQLHVGTGPTADRWFDDVVGRHRAGGRHYHDVRHVRWVVHHVQRLAGQVALADRIVAAAFFHDAIYDATRSDNEVASAALARRALDEIGWPSEAVDHVAAMILTTAGHETSGDVDRATMVLVAADLGVLAAEPAAYGDYVRNVRREHAHLSDDEWRVGRSAFVRSMLDRDVIYPVGLGLDSWERRARANLTAELATMQAISGALDASDALEP